LLKDEDVVASRLEERLATALEKLVAAKRMPDTASDQGREEDEGVSDGKPEEVAPASKLEYKRVDEVYAQIPPPWDMADRYNSWDDKAGKYKLVDSVDSRRDKLDQYVFVVRDRIGKFCIP